jgi:hypothetical protein
MQKENWSDAAGYVAYYAQKGDLVLFNSSFVEIPFNYYFKPHEEHILLQVEKHGIPVDMLEGSVLEPKMTESDIPGLISLVSGRKRVWLVYSHNGYTDPQGIIPQTLASEMKLLQEHEFYGGKVQLYGMP